MRRRQFISLLGAAAACPLAARAQVSFGKRPLIAWLSGGATAVAGRFAADFVDGMRELGYVEGQNFDMVYRYAEGFQDRLPALAQELVQLKPEVIVAAAINVAVPVRHATSTIPIVCPALADAVHLSLIASEARPGGNVTGIEPYVAGLPAKQMEFAREIVPGAHRVGLLTNLQDPKAPPQRHELVSAAKALEVTVVEADVNRPEEIERTWQAIAREHVDVVIVLQSGSRLPCNPSGSTTTSIARAVARRARQAGHPAQPDDQRAWWAFGAA
jgi:putative ABC transport system substrate-binding protein